MGEKIAGRAGLLSWPVLGALGGAAAGVIEALAAGERNTLVVSSSSLVNALARCWFGLTFMSQVFLVAMSAAGLVYRYALPWPPRARRREGEAQAAPAALLTAIAGLYLALAVNAWAPGIRSWQSVAGNAAVLIGCLALFFLFFHLFRRVRLPRRPLLIATLAVEALAAAAFLKHGFYLEASPPSPGEQPDGPNVLLITVDTLRADHLSAYGYRQIRTPGIDRLATEGALITQHYTATSWTLPTLTSLHTGIYPDVHGQIAADLRLDDGLTTLAEVFREGGYLTAGFVTNAYLLQQLGLNRGFDIYVHAGDHGSDPTFGGLLLYRFWRPREVVRHAAEAVTDRAIRFLRRHGEQRWFAWIHYIDPHLPYGDWYTPDLPDYGRDLQATRGKTVTNIDAYLKHGRIPEADDLRHLNAAYDAEIIYTDRQIDRLLAALDDLGLTENTIVVLTADHGEEFWEHGSLFHGYTLYDEVVRAPLLIRGPGRIAAGLRLPLLSGTVDVGPTLLEWAGLPKPKGFIGRSLAGGLRGETPAAPAATLAMLAKHGRKLRAVRTEDFTLIIDEQSGATELYSRADLAQKVNLAVTQPETAVRLREIMTRWEAEAQTYRAALLSGRDNRIELDAGVKQDLRGLGYIN